MRQGFFSQGKNIRYLFYSLERDQFMQNNAKILFINQTMYYNAVMLRF